MIMPRYYRIKNTPNILWDSKTETYYYSEQVERKRYFRSTGIKGKVELCDIDGLKVAVPRSGLGLAKKEAQKIKEGKTQKKILRPKVVDALDLTLTIQQTKSKRTYIIAIDGDKNLRPFFKKQFIYLDDFIKNYEEAWAEYVLYQRRIKPLRKLGHDRKHLIMALRRARKKEWIDRDFIKGDLYLNETRKTTGRALEDQEVKLLINTARAMGNSKLILQILLAVTMGLRKTEILKLKKENIDFENDELDLDPDILKTRAARKVKIPISFEVKDLLKKQFDEANGEYIFPKVLTNEIGNPILWSEAQTDLSSSWKRVKEKAKMNCRFHDLRHTAITNMVAAGMPLSTISKVCGASLEILNTIYDHLNKKSKENFRELFKNRFIND